MAVERVIQLIDEGLSNPHTTTEQAETLRRMRAVYETDDRQVQVRVGAKERRRRMAQEAMATGERVGVPLGRFLTSRGVTADTPILDVVPARVSRRYPGDRNRLFVGQPIKGSMVEGLELDNVDTVLAIKAVNSLRRIIVKERMDGLNEKSVMGDITKLDSIEGSWIGPHTAAIINSAVAQLSTQANPTELPPVMLSER